MIMIYDLIILIIFIIAGFQDFKEKEVNCTIFILGYVILGISSHNLFLFLIPTLILLYFSKNNKICGGADIDALLLLILFYKSEAFLIIIIACILAILISFLKKEKEIPFVGYISIACFCLRIV